MMRFEWNALRIGDRVRVHRGRDALLDGDVVFVNVTPGPNGVGVHVDGGPIAVWWPSFLDVHLAVGGVPEPCPRCDDLVRSA